MNEAHKNTLLLGGMIGLVISDIIPTPADGIFFHLQQLNKTKLNNKEITPKQYWIRNTVAYYGLNPIWWSLFALVTFYSSQESNTRIKIALGLLAGGMVFAVISKNIKKDNLLIAESDKKKEVKNG